MRSIPPLTAEGVLGLWDFGQRQSPVERTHAMLRTALPQRPPEALDALPLGDQQAALLCLLAETFGGALDVVASCEACDELLELELDLGNLLSQHYDRAGNDIDLQVAEYTLRIRPLTGADMRGAAMCEDAASARRFLGERAVISAQSGGEAISPSGLPEHVLARVGEAVAALDPRAEILLDLVCPACGASVTPVIDPGGILWAEISTLALRLLREVHSLASAYGWSESEILRLSPDRRTAYLTHLDA